MSERASGRDRCCASVVHMRSPLVSYLILLSLIIQDLHRTVKYVPGSLPYDPSSHEILFTPLLFPKRLKEYASKDPGIPSKCDQPCRNHSTNVKVSHLLVHPAVLGGRVVPGHCSQDAVRKIHAISTARKGTSTLQLLTQHLMDYFQMHPVVQAQSMSTLSAKLWHSKLC